MSATLSDTHHYRPGNLVRARGREWVVLPKTVDDHLWLRPLGGGEDDATLIYVPLEPEPPTPATFPPPDPGRTADQASGLLLRDAFLLKLRAGAGPFRSFGNVGVEPRAYQLVPLLMALKQDTVRLLIADDVGVGKTVEAGLIARELLDRGEIERLAVLCPPHLCEQWQDELASKFNIPAEIVRTGTVARLERGLPANVSIFDVHPYTVVSLDYIKLDRRRDEFLRACPSFVIVEEAHACAGAGGGRNQRLDLLKGLAKCEDRHMVFLTATPHSGDEGAFHNLLALLDPTFLALQDMPDGPARQGLRERLALHFVQRRRADIREWRDEGSVFPDRETAEADYALSGDWGQLFDAVLAYARGMVQRAANLSLLKQRMSWWAALALLRCVSSSPASAVVALSTRLRAVEGLIEGEQVEELDERGALAVLDGEATDELTSEEAVPAGVTDDAVASEADRAALQDLLDIATALRGPARDPKLKLVLKQVQALLADGFRPVIFCRYIQTAHYVGEHLVAALSNAKHVVEVVTGELPPEERRRKIDALAVASIDKVPVLVATDCLSEGVNLQALFSAVVHYDLSWNPTRHEQREGRVDRFGQPEKRVRALTIYGSNNPVDGAVLKVITRKAERIRKELGVAVPVPADTNKVTEVILQTVLLQTGRVAEGLRQGSFDFGEAERSLDAAWESAKEKARQTRTIFAQNTIRPEVVLPEWSKAVGALGGEQDVERFVRTSCERLRAPLASLGEGRWRLPAESLPRTVREHLEAARVGAKVLRLTFRHPAPAGFEAVHRTHPLVTALADHVAEVALDQGSPGVASRCGAVVTHAVATRTTLFLLRMRAQIRVEAKIGATQVGRALLAEEAVAVAVAGSSTPQVLAGAEALSLMAAEPARNMDRDERAYEVQDSLYGLQRLTAALENLARQRADALLADHVRVRDASRQRGMSYSVEPCLPADVIGCFVLVPA
jgi:superfamily II DNA or RNA helicase